MRSTSRALAADSTTQPITNGVSTKPATVAEVPETVWRNSGTNEIAPNIAMPARNPVTMAASTMRLAKRESGSIGSRARRSTETNTPRLTAAMTSSPTTSSRPQAPTRPASTRASSNAETPTANSAMPATSIVGVRSVERPRGRPLPISHIAIAPNGRLM